MSRSSRRKAASHRRSKRVRIDVRVSASAKQLIRRAVAVSGLTAGDLACAGAGRVLDEHEQMVLISTNRDAFLEAISAPQLPTEKLVAALRRHRHLFG
jgi:uncharacterized protein (DUF1778 family)